MDKTTKVKHWQKGQAFGLLCIAVELMNGGEGGDVLPLNEIIFSWNFPFMKKAFDTRTNNRTKETMKRE